MRLDFLSMRSCYTNRKTKVRKSNFHHAVLRGHDQAGNVIEGTSTLAISKSGDYAVF